MRILVTGNKGYIGSVLSEVLVSRGHTVVGYDIDYYRECTFGFKYKQVPTRIKDIRDVTAEDMEGFDGVCHLAALSNDPLGDINPDLTYDINYKASVRAAEEARKAGVERFVFSSSCSTYGASESDCLLDETAAFNPVTPYGRSKVLVEQEVSRMADENFCPVFLRNATAYGFSPRLRFDLVLNNLAAWAYTTGKVLLKSDGSPWRPIVHVEDICRAFAAVLEAPAEKVHNKAFNVGRTEDNLRIRDIANIVANVIPGSSVEIAEGASPDKRCYRVNCDLLKRTLPEFVPAWNPSRGATQLYEAYQKQRLDVDEFEGPRYQRISHIRKLMSEGMLDEDLRYTAKFPNVSHLGRKDSVMV